MLTTLSLYLKHTQLTARWNNYQYRTVTPPGELIDCNAETSHLSLNLNRVGPMNQREAENIFDFNTLHIERCEQVKTYGN